MDKIEVINRLVYFRTKQNLSARKLSMQLGNDKSYISRMESGEFNLTVTKLFEILKEVNISPEEFFASNYETYREDKNLQNEFINLSDEDKKLVEQLITRLKHK